MTPGLSEGIGLSAVCDKCLRRGLLLGVLAPRIQAVLDSRSRTPRSVLALGDRELIAAIGGRDGEALTFLDEFDPASARRDLLGRGAQGVCCHAPAYPQRLRQLVDAPAMLFLGGHAARVLPLIQDGPLVAIVGSRRPSPYGLEMARELGRGLAAAGVVVVSGLALGIDAASHVGALAGRGTTVAVLGGGVDAPYPKTNEHIHDRIRGRGLLMSEMPPSQQPFRWSFPARNRIMAGLCDATVVVEAARNSGSLITTEFAGDLGRTIGAVPGHATSTVARGSNELLRSGAAVINGPADVLEELFGVRVITDMSKPAPDESAVGAKDGAIDPVERSVLEAVERALGIDAICTAAELPVSTVRAALARLERSGRVKRDVLGGYIRAADQM